MTPTIASLRYFPLKGAQACSADCLEVNTRIGVAHDRWYGIRKKPGNITSRPERFRKGEYHVCANTPAMAIQEPDRLLGQSDEEQVLPRALKDFAARIGAEDSVQLQDTRGEYHLCDTHGPQVSFLNLETLRAFEEFMGCEVDPDRFRMNASIIGLPAFSEYDWVDKYPGTREIMVGDVRLRIDDACERCKAPHANPKTGEYDLDVVPGLERFMGSRGYKSPQRGLPAVMGIYGHVLTDGVIKQGDPIRLL